MQGETVGQTAWASGALTAAQRTALDQVIEHSELALVLLDAIAAPANIGAHLQEAIDRIRETYDGRGGPLLPSD